MKIGIAGIDITPPIGVKLSGFASRMNASIGIHSKLYARVLIFDNGDIKAAIIVCELLGLNDDLVELREVIETETGIPQNNIMIAGTHTHSGPVVLPLLGEEEIDRKWESVLKSKIVRATKEANDNLREAEIGIGFGQFYMGINRRKKMADGSISLSLNPLGLTDPQLGVMRIDRVSNGAPLCIFFNYACHPVILGPKNLSISSDYPGAAMRILEQEVPLAIFTNGACGNINPPIVGGTFNDVNKYGKMLAEEVKTIVSQIQTKPDYDLKVMDEKISIALNQLPSQEELIATIEKNKKVLNNNSGDIHARLELIWAKKVLDLMSKDKLEKRIDLEIQIMKIGDAILIALPGEIFAEISLAIKKRFRRKNIITIGYANGDKGYIFTKEAYKEGGYEVETAYKLYGYPAPISPEAEDRIVEKLSEMIKKGNYVQVSD